MHGRRMFALIMAGWVMAVVPVVSLAQQAGAPAVERPAMVRPIGPGQGEPTAPSRSQLVAELEASVTKLKAEHKALTDELEAIVALARQEKASKTEQRTKQLIATRQREFQGQLESLEKRLNGLKRSLTEADRKAKQEDRVGTQAPLFALKGPDGKEVKLSDAKGKVVVLEWANPDCPYWVYSAKVRVLADLASRYKDVVWLAVNSTARSSPEVNKKTVEQYSLPYPILDDNTGRTAREYGATTTPEVYVIDAKGTIVYFGAIDNSPLGRAQARTINYVDKALKEVLEGKAVTMPRAKPYGSPVLGGR